MVTTTNRSYYSEENAVIWSKRLHTEIEGITVPSYGSGELLYGEARFDYPNYANPKIALDIIREPDKYRDKKFIDLGTGTGLIPLLLTKKGFDVKGIENRVFGYDGAVYTMHLNKIYYDLMMINDNDTLDHLRYDILIMNEIFYDPDLLYNNIRVGRRQRDRGKTVISSLEF